MGAGSSAGRRIAGSGVMVYARARMRRWLVLIILVVAGAAVVVAVVLRAHGGVHAMPRIYLQRYVSARGDAYPYTVYAPPDPVIASSRPVVVVLHGCTMTAGEAMDTTEFNALARRYRFIVLYPDVDPADAGYGRCWKGIWEPSEERRGAGDAGAIAAMTRAVIGRWRGDPTRVYAIGISAGAFEASILGVDYPDVYAAIGIHSGAAYGGGDIGCLGQGEAPAAVSTLARAAVAAMSGYARVMPVLVIHGDLDGRIPYECGQQAVAQWLMSDNLLLRRERRAPIRPAVVTVVRAAIPDRHAYTLAAYEDRAGCVLTQFWTVHGMGHFWSGGSTAPHLARFSDPAGPSASQAAWAFFSHWTLRGPARPCTNAR